MPGTYHFKMERASERSGERGGKREEYIPSLTSDSGSPLPSKARFFFLHTLRPPPSLLPLDFLPRRALVRRLLSTNFFFAHLTLFSFRLHVLAIQRERGKICGERARNNGKCARKGDFNTLLASARRLSRWLLLIRFVFALICSPLICIESIFMFNFASPRFPPRFQCLSIITFA